ncbi:hypothetical protein WA158_006948 [Blastocystis sp. Blastoise]
MQTLADIPTASDAKYEQVYQAFIGYEKKMVLMMNPDTKSEEHPNVHVDTVMILKSYIRDLMNTYKDGTIKYIYSILKKKLWNKRQIVVDTEEDNFIRNGFKHFSKTCDPRKQSPIFSNDDIHAFLSLNNNSLEILQLKVYCITFEGSFIEIYINHSKTNQRGQGTIMYVPKEVKCINIESIVLNYLKYHEYNDKLPLFFTIRKNTLIASPCEINTIATLAKKIAIFLNKPEPEGYTGHSLRKTLATTLAIQGASEMQIRAAGSWKSTGVASRYIEQSGVSRMEAMKQVTGYDDQDHEVKRFKVDDATIFSKCSFSNCTIMVNRD